MPLRFLNRPTKVAKRKKGMGKSLFYKKIHDGPDGWSEEGPFRTHGTGASPLLA